MILFKRTGVCVTDGEGLPRQNHVPKFLIFKIPFQRWISYTSQFTLVVILAHAVNSEGQFLSNRMSQSYNLQSRGNTDSLDGVVVEMK